jgi:hypothetical protein
MTIGNFTPAAFVGSIRGLPLKSGIAFSLFPTVFIIFYRNPLLGFVRAQLLLSLAHPQRLEYREASLLQA